MFPDSGTGFFFLKKCYSEKGDHCVSPNKLVPNALMELQMIGSYISARSGEVY